MNRLYCKIRLFLICVGLWFGKMDLLDKVDKESVKGIIYAKRLFKKSKIRICIMSLSSALYIGFNASFGISNGAMSVSIVINLFKRMHTFSISILKQG